MAEIKTKTKTQKKAPDRIKFIRIQYYRSAIATPTKHKLVVKGLGFTRLNQIVEREDTQSVRGMVKAVPHLVRIVGPEAR
ncbi:MAG: 50S ribosomal protein L30 [Terracidiphilus sp.]